MVEPAGTKSWLNYVDEAGGQRIKPGMRGIYIFQFSALIHLAASASKVGVLSFCSVESTFMPPADNQHHFKAQ